MKGGEEVDNANQATSGNSLSSSLRKTSRVADDSWHFRHDYYSRLASNLENGPSENVCNDEIYIEPLDWLSKEKLQELNGKVIFKV